MLEKFLIPQVYLPIIYICVAILINGILVNIVEKVVAKKQENFSKNSYAYKKSETFKVLLKNITKYTVIIFLILAMVGYFIIIVSNNFKVKFSK